MHVGREKLLLRTPRKAATTAAAAAAMHHGSPTAFRRPAPANQPAASEFTFTASATYAAAAAPLCVRTGYDHHAALGAGGSLEGKIFGLYLRKRVLYLSSARTFFTGLESSQPRCDRNDRNG